MQSIFGYLKKGYVNATATGNRKFALLSLTSLLPQISMYALAIWLPVNTTLAVEASKEQRLFRPSTEGTNSFGISMDSDRNTLLVGSKDDEFGFSAGAVSVYIRQSDNGWKHWQKLTPSDARPYQFFGSSVAVFGDTIAVGARGFLNDTENGVYIFRQGSDGYWTEQQLLVSDDAENRDAFGQSVALTADTLLVAANGDNGSGSAYSFTKNDGRWVQEQKLIPSDGKSGDSFGRTLKLAGSNTVLIGSSWRDTEDQTSSGATYVFNRNADGVWTETQILTAATPRKGEHFGTSIGTDGDFAIVGTSTSYSDLSPSAAYIFSRDQNGFWTLQQQLEALSPQLRDKFGTYVAINKDTVAVGAPFGGPGSVHLFERDTSGVWLESQTIMSSSPSWGAHFGVRVSLSDSHLFVGENTSDEIIENSGSAYAYQLSDQNNPIDNTQDTSSGVASGCSYLHADSQNGWGWNESTNKSCPPASQSTGKPRLAACSRIDSDPDGDGYGWENDTSCLAIFSDTQSVNCQDYGTYPWGWDPQLHVSCRLDN